MDAVQGRFGHAAEQAGRKRADRGLAHLLVLVADGDEQHAGGGAEAGEVPYAHRALDEVVAHRLDVHEHEGVERPVQAKRHEERVEQRNRDGEDERRVRVHPREDDAKAVADPHVVPSVAFSTQWTASPHVLASDSAANCGVMSMAMIEPPSHGSTLSFFDAL